MTKVIMIPPKWTLPPPPASLSVPLPSLTLHCGRTLLKSLNCSTLFSRKKVSCWRSNVAAGRPDSCHRHGQVWRRKAVASCCLNTRCRIFHRSSDSGAVVKERTDEKQCIKDFLDLIRKSREELVFREKGLAIESSE